MWRTIRVAGPAVAASVAGVGTVYIVGMRRRSPAVINAVRKLSRSTKRFQLSSAGTSGAYASIVRHTGRISGRDYQTPIHVVQSPRGDLLVALPYGSSSDWVQNVLASGAATVIYDSNEYAVRRPEVIPLVEVEAAFPPADQRAHRLFGVTECLRLRPAPIRAEFKGV